MDRAIAAEMDVQAHMGRMVEFGGRHGTGLECASERQVFGGGSTFHG